LISFSFKLVSDQSLIGSVAAVIKNLADLQQRAGRQKEADELRAQATAINTKIFGRYRAPVLRAAQLPVWQQEL
jgi:hypothetical protein